MKRQIFALFVLIATIITVFFVKNYYTQKPNKVNISQKENIVNTIMPTSTVVKVLLTKTDEKTGLKLLKSNKGFSIGVPDPYNGTVNHLEDCQYSTYYWGASIIPFDKPLKELAGSSNKTYYHQRIIQGIVSLELLGRDSGGSGVGNEIFIPYGKNVLVIGLRDIDNRKDKNGKLLSKDEQWEQILSTITFTKNDLSPCSNNKDI